MWPFGNQKNPQNEANKYLDKIQPMLTENYDPYLGAGRDPSSVQDNWMSRFQQNPGQIEANERALKQQRAYAGGQGMMGTSSQQFGAGRLANALYNDNMQQYINNNKDLFNTGLNATQSYTGDMSNVLGTQGQLAYNQAREDNTGWNDILQGFLQGAGGAGMGYLTGGIPGAVAGGLGGLSSGMSGNKNGWDVNKFGQNANNSRYGNNAGSFASNQQPQPQPQYQPQPGGGAPMYYPQPSPMWRQ